MIGYLQDFLFSPERARAPITRLSGGERNRLLLARLFAQPSNLLVMDEPTNDLDVETLELLEELLLDYKGTLLLVSHDRDFLDNVVTSTLVLEGDGRLGEYVGGYSDWLRQRAALQIDKPAQIPAKPAAIAPAPATGPASGKRKLSYKDTRELEQLPARIESLEAEIAARSEAMNGPRSFSRKARPSSPPTKRWPGCRPNWILPTHAGASWTLDLAGTGGQPVFCTPCDTPLTLATSTLSRPSSSRPLSRQRFSRSACITLIGST